MQILKVLGKSERPLSSREIEKEILGRKKIEEGKRDPDVYRVIDDELCIRKFHHNFFIFDWNELLSSIDETETTSKKRIESRVIDNLNTIGLDLDEYDYDKMKFSKDLDSTVITITAPRRSNPNNSSLIKIERDPKLKDYATLTLFKNGEQVKGSLPTSLIIKKVGNKEQVFYQGIKGNPVEKGISYLNVSLNDRASKKLKRIESMNPDLFNCTNEVKTIASKCLLSNKTDDTAIISVVSGIESDRRNHEYSLNTRGLILYILGIINEGKARNIEVSKALQNLSENYNKKEEFPFLVHYKEIKELYDKLAIEEGLLLSSSEYEHFQVQIIKQIALELQYSLDTIEKEDLIYYITKRCSKELTWYYMAPLNIFPFPLPKVIREYYAYTQIFIRDYLEEELQHTKSRIKYAISKS